MSEIQIITSQNVSVNFNLGTIGHRLAAFMIDWMIKGAYYYIIIIAFTSSSLYLSNEAEMFFMFIIALPILLYTLLSEIFMNGQTIGKMALGIRVVKINGYAAGTKEFFLRWLTNDVWLTLSLTAVFYAFTNSAEIAFLTVPLIFIIDFIVLAVSKQGQRIGDMLAGTTTILVRSRTHIDQTILENLSEDYQPAYPQVVKLSDGDARIIKEAFKSAYAMNDVITMKRLRQRIEEVIDVKDESLTDAQFVNRVMKDFNYYTQNMV